MTGTTIGEIWLWRMGNRTPLLAISGHTGPMHGVALTAVGRRLASGSEDGTVQLREASRAAGNCACRTRHAH